MKLPLSWLGEFVDLSGTTAQQIADALTGSPFTVEKIENIGPQLQGPIVVGRILEVYPHPNADRIRLTKTQVAPEAEPLEIVCGATNIEAGQVVPVALPGAKVVNRHDGTELTIKLSKIRGVQSNGMLCSPPELGITDGGGDGILILPDDGQLQLGFDVKNMMSERMDVALNITRPGSDEAITVLAVATEIATRLARKLKTALWESDLQTNSTADYRVNIDDFGDCSLYSIRSVSGLKVAAAGLLIKRRIEAAGLRPTNNLVDIVSTVRLEYGEWLQVYDAELVNRANVLIKKAGPEQAFKSVDGTAFVLNPDILIVSDDKKCLSVAGVACSIDSAVSEKTTHAAIEASCFNPQAVEKGRHLLGQQAATGNTPASHSEAARLKRASDRAAYLMLNHCASGAESSTSAITIAERQLV